MKSQLLLSSLVWVIGVPVVFAADVEQIPSAFLSGAFEIGALVNSYSQTDDDVNDTLFGAYGGAFANARLSDNLSFGVDVQGDFLKLGSQDSFEEFTPSFSTALGANAILHFDPVKLGAFAAIGATNHNDDDDGVGFLGGGLIGFDLSPSTEFFAQVGYADIRVDETDSGFTGWFTSGGVVHGFSDNFAVRLAGGYGHAKKGYEDTNGAGTYWNAGLKGVYGFSDSVPVFATASYDYNDFEANIEDSAKEHVVRLGLAFAFGGSSTAKSTFNPYGTSLLPFRAAAYGEVLD